jgi:hypothetical protein
MKKVVSLEISQEMQKKGIKFEATFWWHYHPESSSFFIEKKDFISADGCSTPVCEAYDISELLERLPDEVEIADIVYVFYMYKDNRVYLVGYCDDNVSPPDVPDMDNIPVIGKNLPNALAQLLMWVESKKDGEQTH